MHLGPCNNHSILMCMSLLQKNSVLLDILLLKIDTPLLLRGLLLTWATVCPAASLIQSSGFLLLGVEVGSRCMEREGFWGKSRAERM